MVLEVCTPDPGYTTTPIILATGPRVQTQALSRPEVMMKSDLEQASDAQ
jgi:hypothetical protein